MPRRAPASPGARLRSRERSRGPPTYCNGGNIIVIVVIVVIVDSSNNSIMVAVAAIVAIAAIAVEACGGSRGPPARGAWMLTSTANIFTYTPII